MSMKQTCTNCGAALPEDAVFCHKCGVRVLVPNQPMTTRARMTASENFEPSLDRSFQPNDADDISLTTILKDLEAITADPSAPTSLSYTHDNPFGAAGMYQDQVYQPEQPVYPQAPSYQEPELPPQAQRTEENLLGDYFPTGNNALPASEDDDPWPWELPNFTSTDQNGFPPLNPNSQPQQAAPSYPEAPQMPYQQPTQVSAEAPAYPQPEDTPAIPEAPRRKRKTATPSNDAYTPGMFGTQVINMEEQENAPQRKRKAATPSNDAYTPGMFGTQVVNLEEQNNDKSSSKTSRTSKNKYFDYNPEDDEDFEDEYAEPRRWPFVILAIVLLLAIMATGLYFFMPSVLNKGIDAVNSVAHTHIKHISSAEKEDEPETTITVSAAPAPTVAPTPEATPEPTFDAVMVSDEDYFEDVTRDFANFYRGYLNAMNNDDVASLDHVSDKLKEELQERFDTQNKEYEFTNNQLAVDAPSYFVYTSPNENEYDIKFVCQAFNHTEKRESGEEIISNPIMEVVIHYIPETGEWTVTQMDINNDHDIEDGNMYFV